MSEGWKNYRGSGLSNAFGTVAAAALAALGVHELAAAEPLWVKTAAEAIGSGIGGFGGSYLNEHLLHLPQLSIRQIRLTRLFRAKLLSDFKYSFLGKTADVLAATRESESALRAASIAADSHGGFSSDIPRIISTHPLTEAERSALERTLRRREQIRVNCGTLFPAALAVLISLQERMKGSVDLEIDYSDTNSHDQFERVSNGDYFDFLVAAEGPFFLAVSGDGSGTLNPDGLKHYKRIFPCNIEWQHAFMRKGRDKPSRAHVFQASSAELQFRAGLAASHPGIEQVKVFRGSQVAFLSEKDALSPGECVIAWEPLAHLFQNSPYFETVPNARFRVWISLFCSDTWMSRNRHKQRDAFRALFLDEWRYLNNPAGHKIALCLLERKRDVLEDFALCSGLARDERFAPGVGPYS